jgi:hypothetical protein
MESFASSIGKLSENSLNTKFIFSKLPMDIIKYIFLFDEHFIIRKGKIISIIPKSDYRYNLLKYITFQECIIEDFYDFTRYNYSLYNLHNYKGRDSNNSDLVQVSISSNENNNTLEYVIWIGRQKPRNIPTSKMQMYTIENPKKYHWVYTECEYIRK